MSRYDALLIEAKKKGEGTATDYIPRLYDLLIEEKKSADDARIIIEQDLIDIWSRATIRRHLPEVTKDEKKVKAGKKSAETKKETIAVTTGGESVLTGISTGSGSNDEKGQESRTFNRPSSSGEEQDKEPWQPEGEEDVEFLKTQLAKALDDNKLKDAVITRKDNEANQLKDALKIATIKPANEIQGDKYELTVDGINVDHFQSVELGQVISHVVSPLRNRGWKRIEIWVRNLAK